MAREMRAWRQQRPNSLDLLVGSGVMAHNGYEMTPDEASAYTRQTLTGSL